MDDLSAWFQAGEVDATKYAEAMSQLGERIPEKFRAAATGMQQVAATASQQITDTLGTTIEDVLGGHFSSIGDAWKSMLLSMAAQAIKTDLGNLLFGKASQGGGAGGGGLGGLIGGLFGGGAGSGGDSLSGLTAASSSFGGGGEYGELFKTVFGGAGFGRANGGSVHPMTMTRVNENGVEGLSVQGKDYIMTGGSGAKVTPAGKGGGSTIVNNHIAAGVQRNDLSQVLEQFRAQILGEVQQRQRRPGYAV